jgi:hypothetical protein
MIMAETVACEDILELWYRDLDAVERAQAYFSLAEFRGIMAAVLTDEGVMAECRRRLLVRIASRDAAAVAFAESPKGQAFLASPFLALLSH